MTRPTHRRTRLAVLSAAAVLAAGLVAFGSSGVAVGADPLPGPPATTGATASTGAAASTGADGIPVLPPGTPPPGLPARVAAIARMQAQAGTLQGVMQQQSLVLDQVVARATAARAVADASRQKVEASARLASDAANAADAAESALRAAAIRVYVFGPGDHADKLAQLKDQDPYQLAQARVYASSAFDAGGDVLLARRKAEAQRQQAFSSLASEEQVAKQAAAQVAIEEKAAQDQQAQLQATLAQIDGQVAATEAADRADVARQAALHLASPDALEFAPTKPIPPLMANAANAISWAFDQMGKPYLWGGTGPTAFDCSGLMQFAWAHSGVQIPRTAAQQEAWAVPIPLSALLPGDLVFFGTTYIHHVGMYIGSGLMLNAPHTGTFVSVAPIWWTDLAGFGRVHGPDVVVPPHAFGTDLPPVVLGPASPAGGAASVTQTPPRVPVVKVSPGDVPSEPVHRGDPLDPSASTTIPPATPTQTTAPTTTPTTAAPTTSTTVVYNPTTPSSTP